MSTRDGRASAPTVDRGSAMRQGSVGFTVLLLGGIASGLAARLLPAAGYWWMPLASILGYAVAAARLGCARRGMAQGIVAAGVAWTLVLPVRLFASDGSWDLVRLTVDLALAAVVGALTGSLVGIRAARRQAAAETARAQQAAERRERRRSDAQKDRARGINQGERRPARRQRAPRSGRRR